MNVLNELNVFIDIVKNKEVILYGAGKMANMVLRFLEFKELKDRITCIAVKNRIENPEILQDVPVFTLGEMSIFKNTAVFIICVKNEFLLSVKKDLMEAGINDFFILSDKIFSDISNFLKALPYNILFWNFMSNAEKQWKDLRIIEDEKEEICRLNTAAFNSYKNINRNRDIAVVATGKTVQKYEVQKNMIYIGVNRAYKYNRISFDYLFLQDLGDNRCAFNEIKLGIKSLDCKLFIGKYTLRAPHYRNGYPEEYISDMDRVTRYFVTNSSTIEPIYQDICTHPLTDCFSVVFPAIHFALYTYPRRLYLIGCDTESGEHFYDENTVNSKNYLTTSYSKIKLGYLKIKRFAELYYPETKIISINPLGLKGLFIDQYTN